MRLAGVVDEMEAFRTELFRTRVRLEADLEATNIRIGHVDRALEAIRPLIEEPTVAGDSAPGSSTADEPTVAAPEPSSLERELEAVLALQPPAPEPDPEPTPAREATAEERQLAEMLDLLDHPEWIEGAVKRQTAWVRADDAPWLCDCGKKARTIGNIRQHLNTVVDPEKHHPQIRSILTPLPTEPEVPAVQRPVTNMGDMVKELPWGCSCYARFPTRADWSQHVSEQRQDQRKKHRLVSQPKATMVAGGPHPKPHVEPLNPRVAALADHAKPQLHRNDIGAVV